MKTAVITGASGGIGSAIAVRLAKDGCNVVLNYNKSQQKAQKLCENLVSQGFNAVVFGADVSKPDEANSLIDFAAKKFGSVDILINNAGIAQQKLFTDITDEDFDNMFSSNVKSAFNCCRAALPFMIHNKWGRVVNISSMWGVCGASCEVHYSASKAAVIGLTKALAKEVGPSGITVNCVAPGLIDTPMNKNLDEQTLRSLCDETPAGRIGTPDDIAAAVSFFVSEEAGFATGQVLTVDGGFI
ncbi:MAG: SDR family oxidoreductase [Clostridia bacterium]|nr:SDR family oxidoreductase [Clostridia bacterium]